jgi:hypothetical protein
VSEVRRKLLTKYGITIGICGLMIWSVISIRTSELGAFSQLSTLLRYRVLCDAFTVPGMLLIMSGLLMFVANEGALDGLSYLGHYLKNMFIPGSRNKTKRYFDYVEGKREKRVKGFGFLFVVGGVCMLIALVFLGLFYTL